MCTPEPLFSKTRGRYTYGHPVFLKQAPHVGPTCRLHAWLHITVRRRLRHMERHPRLVVVFLAVRHLLEAVENSQLSRAEALGRVAIALPAPSEQITPASYTDETELFSQQMALLVASMATVAVSM